MLRRARDTVINELLRAAQRGTLRATRATHDDSAPEGTLRPHDARERDARL